MIECFFLVEQNLDFDRQHVKMAPDLIAQTLYLQQPRLVFFCSDDELGRGEAAKRLVDLLYILLVESMVVAEGQRCHLFGIALEVGQHLFWRGNARQ